ncbi:hypothetical protein [Flavobacterium hungaricum]|uniref:Uncharacterized protein n=1 Tax=Flavobacterium hungaricum TaxID=2082725 RepID=A0ABR9TJ08_9FLAO|nr:hypothetical protein [Flavobacterium hungaricum]MBE8725343.1 hypothetical protein [Flavobacterium hungaricum]
MRNYIWSFSIFFSVVFSSFSQTKNIEKGSYLSTAKGEQIKLNLLEDNKFELVFYSGEYQIKGDSLLFVNKKETDNGFDLQFKREKNPKKIKIKYLNPSYYSTYIGTQKGSEAVTYKKLMDIQSQVDPNFEKETLDFEIERTDYLYLVNEGYYDVKTTVAKYEIPKDVGEISIKYEPNLMNGLNISGFFDKNTNELKIAERAGKNPLVFKNEKDIQTEIVSKTNTKIKPLETQNVTNWTYPGKENTLLSDDFGNDVIVDSTAVAPPADYIVEAPNYTSYDFKLKIENNLKSALTTTKDSKSKYLVVYTDSKNTAAKTEFDAFVKDQEKEASYNMYDKYNPVYDIFNYYLTGKDDKKWLKNNKIESEPSVIVLNGNGDVLAKAKSNLSEKQYQFSFYGDLYRKLQRTNALVLLEKTIQSKKPADADLIKAFNLTSALEFSYDYDSESSNEADFAITKVALDKKEVSQIWKKLIEAHQKDSKPDMYLVETIVKEIKNQGFTKQLFNEERILNDTDFLAIDYLLKHAVSIEEKRQEFISKEGEIHSLGNIYTEISSALQQNMYVPQDGISGEINKDKAVAIYKKIVSSGNGSFDAYRNYFAFISQIEDNDGSKTTFLKEFSRYFDNQLASGKESPIEKLDTIFSNLDSSSSYSYDGWAVFKEYHSNLCNDAAWSVVSIAANSSFIKDAIKWSEYSLIITKNNPYYLDTLAQLYYKDGQKEKALETQTLAVKYLTTIVDELTAADIRQTLEKMKNGTY